MAGSFHVAMTQSQEVAARYHKLIESEPYRDMSWARDLQVQMQSHELMIAGRPVSPVVRPHFLTRRQYTAVVRTAETLLSALDRVAKLALATPALLSRLQLLPAEKMLASISPGYPYGSVTALVGLNLDNGTPHLWRYDCEDSTGATFGDALADVFYESAPMQELRKKYALSKVGESHQLLDSLLCAYRGFGGQQKTPRIALLEFRHPFQTAQAGEDQRLLQSFHRAGYAAEVVSPEQLEYRNGVLRRGDFEIDIIYRRVQTREFLYRCDLNHPLVRAYRDHVVCMVNSFRAEMGQKLATYDLLTDRTVTAQFPIEERKVIEESVPWTRIVAARQTSIGDKTVDLLEYIRQNREQLVLRPDDPMEELATVVGAQVDEAAWERAIRTALRNLYVVQEAVPVPTDVFPILRYGHLEMQRMRVEVMPHAYLGKVHSTSAYLTVEGQGGFSTLSGITPTFILESKS